MKVETLPGRIRVIDHTDGFVTVYFGQCLLTSGRNRQEAVTRAVRVLEKATAALQETPSPEEVASWQK